MCVVLCCRWQSDLSLVGGNVCFCVFDVAMCVVVSFRWQCVLYVLGGNVCYRTFRWQTVVFNVLVGNVFCSMFQVAK